LLQNADWAGSCLYARWTIRIKVSLWHLFLCFVSYYFIAGSVATVYF
jgi:hypothetical protein